MEQDLVLLCYIFRMWRAHTWNALCHCCFIISVSGTRSGVIVLYFSTGGMRSHIIVLYFQRMERALVFYVKFISCCYILTL